MKRLLIISLIFAATPAFAEPVEDSRTIEVPAPKHRKLKRLDSARDWLREPGTPSMLQAMFDFTSANESQPVKAMTRWRGNNVVGRKF